MLRYCNPSVREDSHTERSEVSLFPQRMLGVKNRRTEVLKNQRSSAAGAPSKPSLAWVGVFDFDLSSRARRREGSAVISGAGALAGVNFLSSPLIPQFHPN